MIFKIISAASNINSFSKSYYPQWFLEVIIEGLFQDDLEILHCFTLENEGRGTLLMFFYPPNYPLVLLIKYISGLERRLFEQSYS